MTRGTSSFFYFSPSSIDIRYAMAHNEYMNTNKCQHEALMVSGGVVRCSDCLTWLHDHKDSDARPGLVKANQER